MSIEWNIKPEQFLREQGLRTQKSGNWLRLKHCPFCDGGHHRDILSFAIHSVDGNYTCLRTKCGEKGNFWNLILHFGKNPKDYVERFSKKGKKKKKKFVYNRRR